MRKHHIDFELRYRANRYMEYMYERNETPHDDIKELLSNLSVPL